jgi:hypothetical protein
MVGLSAHVVDFIKPDTPLCHTGGCNLRNCPRALLIENPVICCAGILREWLSTVMDCPGFWQQVTDNHIEITDYLVP